MIYSLPTYADKPTVSGWIDTSRNVETNLYSPTVRLLEQCDQLYYNGMDTREYLTNVVLKNAGTYWR